MPIPIRSDKGLFNKQFCSGANLDSDDEEAGEEKSIEMNVLDNNPVIEQPLDEEHLTLDKKKVFRRFLFWICGMTISTNGNSRKQDKQIDVIDTSIDEDHILSVICNVSAVIIMAIVGFMFGFFNKYN